MANLRVYPRATRSYTGAVRMLGGSLLFVAVEGETILIEDKGAFADYWIKDLDRYFPNGIDTPGIVMLRVSARAIHYWDGSDEAPSISEPSGRAVLRSPACNTVYVGGAVRDQGNELSCLR